MSAFKGQPWRVQPWNTKQDDEALGPWTRSYISLPSSAVYYVREGMVGNRVFLHGMDNDRNNSIMYRVGADIEAGVVGSFSDDTSYNEYLHTTFNLIDGVVWEVSGAVCAHSGQEWECTTFSEVAEFNVSMFFRMGRAGSPYAFLSDAERIVAVENKIHTLANNAVIRGTAFTWEYDDNGQITDWKRNEDYDESSELWRQLQPEYSAGFFAPVTNISGGRHRIYFGKYISDTEYRIGYWEVDNDGTILYDNPQYPDLPALRQKYVRSVVTAKRVYLFSGDGYASAPVHDDATLGVFAEFNMGWGFPSAETSNQMAVFVTSNRIYVVVQNDVWHAPFKGGKDDYTDEGGGGGDEERPGFHLEPEITAQGEDVAAGTFRGRVRFEPVVSGTAEDVAAGTVAGHTALSLSVAGKAETTAAGAVAARYDLRPTIAGQGEAVSAGTPVSGRYDLRPVIEGSGETAAQGTLAGRYDLRPEIAARGESAAAGTTGGRYDLRPEVAASGESVRAGTLAADYELAPEIGATGESAASGKSAGNYNLFLPSVRATGEQAARGAMRALFAVRPTIRAKGETVARGTVAGHCRIAPAIFGQARKTGRVRHAYGNYVLPVPFRIRGTCEQRVGDWVLRFKRPEVL